MRTTLLAAVVLGALAAPALADDGVAGSYEVKFDEGTTTCSPPPVTYQRGKLVIAEKKGSLTVNIETIYQMTGVPQKNGKVAAKTTKVVGTTIAGLDARYSIGGRVEDNGVAKLVLVAEYIAHDTKKAYCTQSWNLTGLREAASDKAPDKKAARHAADGAALDDALVGE